MAFHLGDDDTQVLSRNEPDTAHRYHAGADDYLFLVTTK
jgi:hypothetical protein